MSAPTSKKPKRLGLCDWLTISAALNMLFAIIVMLVVLG